MTGNPGIEELAPRHSAAMMRSVPPPLRVLERGEGAWVWDVAGNKYLDFLAGIAVNALGHAHPALVNALSDQAAKLVHISNYFASRPQIELAERILQVSGAGESGRVYFCNSGAEAIEAAFKLARRSGRTKTIALRNGFHGRTMGSLTLTGKPVLRDPFEPLVPGVEHIDSTIEALEAAIDDEVAALFVEPIKGEAGVVELPAGFLERARELTREHGALLILDEIQTGIARTGDWFAFQHHGIVPDAMTIAKGMGGGFPIGALVTFGEAGDLLLPGQHGSTYSGNPLGTAASLAVLTEIERSGLVENARRRGEQLKHAILGLGSPLVAEVRGRGLLLGIGLAEPVAAQLTSLALDAGLIVNAANESSVRIAPPLTIGDEEIGEFIARFKTALEAA